LFNGQVTLVGGAGDDTLTGGSKNDKLLGGAGTLTGGAGADYLVGGDGADTYIYSSSDGMDVISDSLGTSGNDQNKLKINGKQDITGYKKGDLSSTSATFVDSDGNLYDRSNNHQDLLIRVAGGGTITLKNYSSQNNYGITLSDDNSPNAAIYTEPTSAANRSDWVKQGRSSGDEYHTLGGRDRVTDTAGGNDMLLGGSINTATTGALADNDYIYGGKDNDLINGGVGNDWLVAA
jgi:hypothetical protein